MTNVVDFEQAKSDRLKPFRLGVLAVEGSRVRLNANCSLTRAACILLAQNLIELAKQLPKGSR